MDKATRKGLHDLLDRALDGDDWSDFCFYGYGEEASLRVKHSVVVFQEKRPRADFMEAIKRAKEAIDE